MASCTRGHVHASGIPRTQLTYMSETVGAVKERWNFQWKAPFPGNEEAGLFFCLLAVPEDVSSCYGLILGWAELVGFEGGCGGQACAHKHLLLV